MKCKYKLKRVSYVTTCSGWDYCLPDINEVWEITKVDSVGVGRVVQPNGTPHSLEDCYKAILIDAGIDLEIEGKKEDLR